MAITLSTSRVGGLNEVARSLRGVAARRCADAVASGRPGLVLAVRRDEALARQRSAARCPAIGRGVGRDAQWLAVADLLLEVGWNAGESWTPLRRDLEEPVEDPGLRVAVVGPKLASDDTAVHRSSFGNPGFTDERWQAMVTGLPHRDGRCRVAYDDEGNAVAEVAVFRSSATKRFALTSEPESWRRRLPRERWAAA